MNIIDSHIHLIDVEAHDWYPGLKVWGEAVGKPDLYQTFTLQDHRDQAGAAGIQLDGFVHVSATTKPGAYLDETRWVSALADAEDLRLALIGTVDPALSPTEIVAELDEQAGHDRFRGVRVLYGFEPDSAAASAVLSWLADHDAVFDLVINPDAMTGWLDRLRRTPELRVVLEHTGWPAATDEAGRRAWEQAMERFAGETEAPCKLSGLGMVTRDLGYDSVGPWLERAVELLGWDRVMFGSNMPIETMGGSHPQLIESMQRLTDGVDQAEAAKFWGGNAAASYRL